jgi:hypothetical protein
MNSFNTTDITDQYLCSTYDNFQKEQARIMTSLNASDNLEIQKEKDLEKQIAMLNSLMLQLLKLKGFRKKLLLKC